MADEAEYGLTQMAFGAGEGPQNINPTEYEGLLVRFILEPWLNSKKSKEEGRPIYDEIPFVDIRVPGDRTSHQFRPASDIDKARWPRHWEAFESKGRQGATGTPLEEWPAIGRSLVRELQHFHVTTVEQLATLSDTAAQQFMGIQAWKQRAKIFLEMAEDGKASAHLASELESRDNEIAALKDQMAKLMEAVEKKDPTPKKAVKEA